MKTPRNGFSMAEALSLREWSVCGQDEAVEGVTSGR